jgi:hypothetical protein
MHARVSWPRGEHGRESVATEPTHFRLRRRDRRACGQRSRCARRRTACSHRCLSARRGRRSSRALGPSRPFDVRQRRSVLFTQLPQNSGSAAAMQAQTRSLSTQAPRTTATANSFFRSSTASTRSGPPPASCSSQDQQPTRPSPIPSQRRLSNGPNSRPCVTTTLARVLRSSASSICLRSTRPLSRNPLFALR